MNILEASTAHNPVIQNGLAPGNTQGGEGGDPTTMPIASLTIELAIEHAQSLKDRRQVVRSLKDKLRHGFNISVAELDDAMVWNRATLGVAAISSSSAYLAGQLREVEDAVRRLSTGLGCEVMDAWIEANTELESSSSSEAAR
jgi:uncharacterized protein YlxP (DUF503 family)